VFLFAGPTGTGKTSSPGVSEFLFGSVERMIRLDMSEFQTMKRLARSSPKLCVGHRGRLADQRVRKQPFSVVLLDEFEKSHSNVWDLFLQAFDEGRLTDAMGQVATCATADHHDVESRRHRPSQHGLALPAGRQFSKDQVLRAISLTYRPEFRNRLDKIIVFQPLTRDLMRGILKKELAALLERAA